MTTAVKSKQFKFDCKDSIKNHINKDISHADFELYIDALSNIFPRAFQEFYKDSKQFFFGIVSSNTRSVSGIKNISKVMLFTDDVMTNSLSKHTAINSKQELESQKLYILNYGILSGINRLCKVKVKPNFHNLTDESTMNNIAEMPFTVTRFPKDYTLFEILYISMVHGKKFHNAYQIDEDVRDFIGKVKFVDQKFIYKG